MSGTGTAAPPTDRLDTTFPRTKDLDIISLDSLAGKVAPVRDEEAQSHKLHTLSNLLSS